MFPPTQAQVWGEHVLATSREDRTSVTILPSIKCIRALIRFDQVGSGWPCNNSFRRFSLHIWWARLVHNGWTTQHLRRYKTWCLGHVWNLKEIERIEWAGPIVNHSFLRSIFPKCFGRYRMSKSCERCCTFCYMWWDLQVYQWVDNPSYGRPAATPPQPYVQVGQLIVPSLFSISVCLIWIKSLTNWRRISFSEPWIWFWENISRCFAGSTNQSILSRQGACGMRGWGSKTPATSKHQRHDWQSIRIDMMFRKFGTQIRGRLSSLLRRRPLWSASSDGQIMQCHSVFLVAGLHISKGQVDQFLQESEVTRINTWVWRFALFMRTHW